MDCKGENKAIMILRFPSGNRIKFVLYQLMQLKETVNKRFVLS